MDDQKYAELCRKSIEWFSEYGDEDILIFLVALAADMVIIDNLKKNKQENFLEFCKTAFIQRKKIWDNINESKRSDINS